MEDPRLAGRTFGNAESQRKRSFTAISGAGISTCAESTQDRMTSQPKNTDANYRGKSNELQTIPKRNQLRRLALRKLRSMLERQSQRRDGTQPMRYRERYCARIRVRWTDPEAHRQAPELGRQNLSGDELPGARRKAPARTKASEEDGERTGGTTALIRNFSRQRRVSSASGRTRPSQCHAPP